MPYLLLSVSLRRAAVPLHRHSVFAVPPHLGPHITISPRFYPVTLRCLTIHHTISVSVSISNSWTMLSKSEELYRTYLLTIDPIGNRGAGTGYYLDSRLMLIIECILYKFLYYPYRLTMGIDIVNEASR
jgi:hypothetical protein